MITDFESLQSALPNYIKIAGIEYYLNLIKDYAFISDNKTEINDGEFDINKGEIRLATTLKDGKTLIDLDRTITVLLHEILHGIFYHYLEDFTENEEHLVTQLAKGLYQVLKENPELTKLINKESII